MEKASKACKCENYLKQDFGGRLMHTRTFISNFYVANRGLHIEILDYKQKLKIKKK